MPKVGPRALAEVEAAYQRYEADLNALPTLASTRRAYLLHFADFIRWLKDESGPGGLATQRVILECLGNIPGPRFLDGHTADGTVGLAPSTIPPYTGTWWELAQVPNGNYTLRCLGNIEGARFLDGRTADGTVGLALDTDLETHSGTYWELSPYTDEPPTFTLKCMGNVDGNRFLDGRTENGSVGLAPAPGGVFTGAIWGIYIPFA